MTRISFYLILSSFALFFSCSDSSKAENTNVPSTEKAVVVEEQDLKTRIIEGSEFAVDSDNSRVDWSGTKVNGSHSGTLSGIYGAINLDKEGQLFLGKFVIPMKTLKVTDIQDPRDRADLEDHLKSADFFDVKNFGETSFQTTEIIPIEKEGINTHRVTGTLNMHGVRKSISFPAMIKITENSLIFKSASFKIDRTKWDIKYKSGVIGTIKDKLIHDEIGLQISLVASKMLK